MNKVHFAGLAILLAACTRVDETELCTLTTYGNVSEKVMSPGLEMTVIDEVTCFPKIQQVYPGGRTEDNQPNSVVVEALTRDSVKLTIALAVEHQINAGTYFDSVFVPKRTTDNFEIAVGNGVREGARVAIGGVNSGEAFLNREVFGTALEQAIQRSLGSLTHVTRVYLTDMDLPPVVEEARQKVYEQGIAEQQALKQRRIDSLNNVTKLQNSETAMRVQDMRGRTYENNPVLADLEVKKANAEAMAKICAGTSTCILGSSVLESMGLTKR
jgi:hypothetical protein